MKTFRKIYYFTLSTKIAAINLLLISLSVTGYSKEFLGHEILTPKVTIDATHISMNRILVGMEEQSHTKISYSSRSVEARKKAAVQNKNEYAESLLYKLFGDQMKVTETGEPWLLVKANNPSPNTDLSTLVSAYIVKGTVVDEAGAPMPGVNVAVKGTTTGATTDTNGEFALDIADSNATLVLSFMGYLTKEVAVGNQTTINVSMEPDVKKIDEVVVVGYGTTKAKDLTGSVATINSESFNKGIIATPDQLLQGRTAGVTVTPSSGEPGAAVTINIRGTSAIRGNNDPLYVIDGVPVNTDIGLGPSYAGGNAVARNPLSFLNPRDIESITVLKDASSAAIYGSRGANGVILITTKKGTSGNVLGSFNYSAYVGVSVAAKRYDLCNGSEFLSALKQANIESGGSPESAAAGVAPGSVNNKGADTDWQSEMFRTGISNGHSLGWGMSKGKTSLRLSGSYDDQKGIIKYSDLTRLTGRINLSQKLLNDKLQIDVSATLANVKNGYTPNATEFVVRMNPTYPVYNADNTFSSPPLWFQRNVTEMLTYITDTGNTRQLLSNIGASYTITPGLVFKSTLGYNNSFSLRKTFADPRLPAAQYSCCGFSVFGTGYPDSGAPGFGNAIYQRQKNTSVLTEETITWDRKIGQDAINAVVGYSYQDFITETNAEAGYGVKEPVVKPADNFIKDIDNFKNRIVVEPLPSLTTVKLQSFFGRINYSINNKYLFTATARIDGSSKFGEGNRYGTFPAFAAKWKLLNESFAEGLSKAFYDLSIRANWGKLGSQDGLGAYDAVDFSTRWKGTTRLEHQGNKNLKWEVATTTGVGLDWELANRRLSGTIDYYHTQRDNLIFFGPVPGGFSATANYFSNLPGYVLNTGLEFSFLAEAIQGKNFNWNVNYNMTFYQNQLHNFNQQVYSGSVSGQGLWSSLTQTLANGQPLFAWYLPVFTGFNSNGVSTYESDGASQFAGSPLPTFTAGLTNNFSYKNWNLSIFFNTSRGFYVYNNTANAFFNKGSLTSGQNITKDVLTSKESPLNPTAVSTRFLEKGDFIRLSNLSLGYNYRPAKSFIKSMEFTFSGQNLWLFTEYSGLDPEISVNRPTGSVPTRGVDYLGYPKARTVTFGLNVGF